MKRIKQFKTMPQKQKGLTMIETIIAITLGILVLVGGAIAIARGFNTNELSNEVSGLTQLIANTKTLRSSGGYGASGTNLVPALIATGGVPKDMTVIGGVLKNAWNGDITVVSTGAGYAVTTRAVPQDQCTQLASKISAGPAVSTKIGGTAAVTGEITPITAATSCSAATQDIVFTTLN